MTGTPRSRARLNGGCGFQRFSSGRVNGRNRRFSRVRVFAREGLLAEPIAGPQLQCANWSSCPIPDLSGATEIGAGGWKPDLS
jgi:hypothetical protein